MILALDLPQFETGFPEKFRVVGEKLHGPRDLVLDALSRAVTRFEKLKVFKPVVGLHAVDVVDRFVREKLSSEVLFHDVAVVKSVFTLLARGRANTYAQVPVATLERLAGLIPARFNKLASVEFTPASYAACRGAKPAESTSVVLSAGHFLSASSAHKKPIVVSATAFVRTASRAVQRVFTENLPVLAKFAGVSLERCSAVLAGKQNRFNTHGSVPFVQVQICSYLFAVNLSSANTQGVQ